MLQLQYVLRKWDVDTSFFAETQDDLRHANEGHSFDNLLVCGSDRRIVISYNFTVEKILSPRNQRGGTVMMTFGKAVASVCEVDRDKTKLGRF